MENHWKKNVTLFLVSQTISLFGSSLVQYAITWHITMETQSGALMTIVIIAGFLPTFILSPFAGVWADRYNRKLLIILSDALIAVATLILAILFHVGYDRMWLLFITPAIRAIGTGVQVPAIGAFLPQIVPSEKLNTVNATNSSIQSIVMLASPVLSGFLMQVSELKYIFFIDVITALIAIFILALFLHTPAHAKAQSNEPVRYFKDLREGIGYIGSHPFLKKFFIFDAIFFFLAAPVAFLTPLQVTRTFGNDVWRLTAIEITFSVGMLVGGILMMSWKGFPNKIHTMFWAGVFLGVCTFALGAIPVFWIYLFFMVVTGAAIPVFSTPSTVLLQQKVDADYMGRVFGVMGMISSATMPVGMLIFGPAADTVAIEWLLIGTGVMMVIQSILMVRSKTLIAAGEP